MDRSIFPTALPEPTDLTEALAQRLFYGWTPIAAMSALGPLSIAAVLWGQAPRAPLLIWLVLSELVGAAAIALGIGWRRLHVQNALRSAVLICLLNGGLVGLLMPLFFVRDSLAAGVLPATVCAVAGSATIALQAHRPAMMAMILGCLAPLLLWTLGAAPEARLPTAALVLLFAAMLLTYGLRAHTALRELLSLRLENRRLLIESERRRQLAEQADEAKTRFLAAASHDLRQPMSALSMQLDALAFGVDGSARAQVARLQVSAAALSELLDGLLDLSRLDTAMKVQPQSIDIAQLVRDLHAEFLPAAQARGLQLRLYAPPELPARVDPTLLLRALRNLLTNALRYTARGGVLLAARRRGAAVRIDVVDTGIGIAPDHQPRVFDEFFQVASDANTPGLGLGLALVKRIVAALRAEIRLRSRLGRGTRFTLVIPANVCPDRAEAPANAEALRGRQVLAIEDDPENRYALHALLQLWGCDVVAVESLESALLAMVDARLAPDLLVSDYRLGAGPDGVTAIERLRDEFNRPLPAVLLTADEDHKAQAQLAASGIAVLRKPIGAERLKRALVEALASAP